MENTVIRGFSYILFIYVTVQNINGFTGQLQPVIKERYLIGHIQGKLAIRPDRSSYNFFWQLISAAEFQISSVWNLENTAGKFVAPGLYIYKVDTPNGLSKVGKFAVIR